LVCRFLCLALPVVCWLLLDNLPLGLLLLIPSLFLRRHMPSIWYIVWMMVTTLASTNGKVHSGTAIVVSPRLDPDWRSILSFKRRHIILRLLGVVVEVVFLLSLISIIVFLDVALLFPLPWFLQLMAAPFLIYLTYRESTRLYVTLLRLKS